MKIRIDLTKKDADIAAFKNSLPKGEWSKNVVQIMNAAMRDRVADIPSPLYTSDAAEEKNRVDLGGHRNTKKKKEKQT